jgi:hypothetical protein
MAQCSFDGCDRVARAVGLCNKHYMRKWYIDHPEGREVSKIRMRSVPREVARNRRLKHHYGIDSAWYEQQLEKQNGVCAICHKPENKTINGKLLRLAVDHCHDTGLVRGLLCQACNRGIGCFSHDTGVLQSAIAYLAA